MMERNGALRGDSAPVYAKSEFDAPYSFEKIEEWEKANCVEIPDMYKSWLLLTSYTRIMDGLIELFFPKTQMSTSIKDGVYIGSLGYGSNDLCFSKKTGAIYAVGDEVEEYEDFLDFLTYVHIRMEDEAEEEYGKEWVTLYDEKFPEG